MSEYKSVGGKQIPTCEWRICGCLSNYCSWFIVWIVLCGCRQPAQCQRPAPARGPTPTLTTSSVSDLLAVLFGQIARCCRLTFDLQLSLCARLQATSLYFLDQTTHTVITPFYGEAQELAQTPGLGGEASLLGIRVWPTDPRWWSRHKAGVASNKQKSLSNLCLIFATGHLQVALVSSHRTQVWDQVHACSRGHHLWPRHGEKTPSHGGKLIFFYCCFGQCPLMWMFFLWECRC